MGHTAKTPEDTFAEDTLADTPQAGHTDFHTDSPAEEGEEEEMRKDSQDPVPRCFVAHTGHNPVAERSSSMKVVPAVAPPLRAREAVVGGEGAGALADRAAALRCFLSMASASTLRKRKGLSVVGSG
jgi:hypothetical protein